jgi:hypothetical protein
MSVRDSVIISSVEWEPLWQGPQEIAARLARDGARVLFVENMGVRTPSLADAGRVTRRLRNWYEARCRGGVREVRPDLFVCTPIVLPPFGPAWRRWLNRHFLLPAVRRAAHELSLRAPIIWNFLPTDTALDLVTSLSTPESRVVY